MKRTMVLLVERTIAAAAAERMRLGVTLTDTGHQKGDGTEHKARERTRRRMYLSKSREKTIISGCLLHGFL
jgi:hypothetical protein